MNISRRLTRTAQFSLAMLATIPMNSMFVTPLMSAEAPAFSSIDPATSRSITLDKPAPVLRQRLVKANKSAFARTRGGVIKLNLFDDVSLDVVVDRVEMGGTRSIGGGVTSKMTNILGDKAIQSVPVAGTTQIGTVKGMPQSEVVLTQQGDRVFGSVHLPTGEVFEIQSKTPKVQVIRQLDPAAFKDHGPTTAKKKDNHANHDHAKDETIRKAPAPLTPKPSAAKDLPTATAKTTPTFSVLTIIPPSTYKQLGGTDQAVGAYVRTVQAQTNQSFEKSGVNMRISLGWTDELKYPETGDIEKDLNFLHALDEKANIRKRGKFHAVSMWVTQTPDGICGLGNVNQTPADFKQHAFSVVLTDCILGNFSFTHELGHNWGSCHTNDGGECPSVFPHSFGYRDAAEGDFRTIMAYACDVGKKCPRFNYWSSPNLLFGPKKKPMGVPGKADNIRSLNSIAQPYWEALPK